MEIERLSDKWLFERHSKEEISRWVNDLKYSYFIRAWGGHANDGDEFKLTLNYKNKSDLSDTLKKLGISIKLLPKNQPESVSDVPEFEQPRHIDLNHIKCFCWIENGKISFSLSGGQDGDLYEVTETDFENCKKLEQLIVDNNLTGMISRDLENNVTCISKARYAGLFE